jgi:myo-inositol-1(or 4)-monophosphatase
MDKLKINKYSEIAINTLSGLSDILRAKRHDGFRVIRKEQKEMVTELDMYAQDYIKDRFLKEMGDIQISSEEMSDNITDELGYWSIDPIDGTHNFIAGLPSYGISAAYIEDGKVLIGVISIPEANSIYSAIKGSGALYNGKKINVSSVDDLSKSIIAYDNQFHLSDLMIKNFIAISEASFTTRIHGSSVVDASYVAKGLLSARIYNSTKLCDIAAGILLVEEAGGISSDFDGNRIDLSSAKKIVISAPHIHDELISILNK